MKIYDCFIFFNEIEMLKIRFNYLNDIVDYFVIVEANTTFQEIKRIIFFNNILMNSLIS